MSSQVCGRCGAPQPDNVDFCSVCGNELSRSKRPLPGIRLRLAQLLGATAVALASIWWLGGRGAGPEMRSPTLELPTQVIVGGVTVPATNAPSETPAGEDPQPPPLPPPSATPNVSPPTPTATATREPSPTPRPTATLQLSALPVVFDSTRDGGAGEIYLMNADGSNQRRLTDTPAHDSEADLSYDGEWIVFQSGRSGTESLLLMRIDGSEQRWLLNGSQPAWSPDGDRIAFETNEEPSQLRILEVNSGRVQTLTNDAYRNRTPNWSPDGREIVYASRRDDFWQLVVIEIDMGRQRQITSRADHHLYPSWSPDGAWIVFNTSANDWPDDIWVITPFGDRATALTNDGFNGRAAWSPEGRFVIFNRYWEEQDRWVIVRIEQDGSRMEQLTFLGNDQRVDWGR